MIRIYLMLLASFSLLPAMGQLTPLPPPTKEPARKQLRKEEKNQHCRYRNKYSAAQRAAFYPFNTSMQIRLVSFDVRPDTTEGTDLLIGNSLPIQNNMVDKHKLDESIILTKMQIDSLTDLLYNTGFGGPVFTGTVSSCFTPRNAILFEQGEGKTFAYIEICFQCNRMEPSSEDIALGEPCRQKMNLLKQFFIRTGIRIGTLTWKGMDE